MPRPIFFVLALGLMTLTLSGCGQSATGTSPTVIERPKGAYDFAMTVAKSASNTRVWRSDSNQTMISVKELLDASGIDYTLEKTGAQEKMTMLDNVITTASKDWNLYVDDAERAFITLSDIMIEPASNVEWRYEPK